MNLIKLAPTPLVLVSSISWGVVLFAIIDNSCHWVHVVLYLSVYSHDTCVLCSCVLIPCEYELNMLALFSSGGIHTHMSTHPHTHTHTWAHTHTHAQAHSGRHSQPSGDHWLPLNRASCPPTNWDTNSGVVGRFGIKIQWLIFDRLMILCHFWLCTIST